MMNNVTEARMTITMKTFRISDANNLASIVNANRVSIAKMLNISILLDKLLSTQIFIVLPSA